MEEETELDYFSNLNASDQVVRLNAVKGILKRMKYEAKHNHKNLFLICKRLIRGMGGSKTTFRQGCFACIVGLMSHLPPDFDVSVFEEIIENELHPSGNDSKQEKGEAYLGQIMAYGSLITTNLIFGQSEDVQVSIFTKIFQLGKKRSYLRHVSYVFMNDFLMKSNQEFIPDGFLDDLRDLNDNPLDKLHYLLILENKPLKKSTTKKVLGTKSFFDLSNVGKVVGFLKKSKMYVTLEHSFIKELSSNICNHPEFFKSFWMSLVDQKYVKSKPESTTEHIKTSSCDDLLILNISCSLLKAFIENSNMELTKVMWNQNLISVLVYNSKKNKNIVQMFLNDFCNFMKTSNDETKLSILRSTLFEYGFLNFDVLTSSKTIFILSNSLTFEALAKLADSYKAVIENKKEIVNFDLKNKNILLCLHYYTKLINSPACYEEISWRTSQLIYLLKLAFFKQPGIHVSRELISHFQEAFLTSLGHRFPNLDAFQKVLNELFLEFNKLFINPKNDKMDITFEISEAWEKSLNLNIEMSKHIDGENKEVMIVLKMLLQYMSLLILKEPSTAIINIQDLNNIFLEIIEGTKTNWIGVLIDLFLNLLSKPNYHHRHLIHCIFKFLCQYITEEVFDQIVEVLLLSYDPRNILENNEEQKSDESDSESNSDNESESEAEDVSDGEDEISANEKLRFELRNVLAAESDVESIDLDDMDEDEGKRLNETLGNIFKYNMKRKRTDHLSKYQNQLSHFRIRVIDLLEICTEAVLPFSYWLKVLIPLTELYGSTVGVKQLDNLKSKIKCFIKKLNSSKVILDGNIEKTVGVLEEMFKKLSKSTGVYFDMKMELCSAIKFILKSSKPFITGLKEKHLLKNEIFCLFKKQLDDFFLSNNNIPINLFINVISMGWDGILALFPNIVNFVFNGDVKQHRRLQGVKMIETFVKTPQFFDGHLEKYYEIYLKTSADTFHDSFVNVVEKVCTEKDINMKFFCELWSILFLIFQKQKNNSSFPEFIDQENVKDFLNKKLEELPIMKGQCKKNFQKLCNFLNIRILINQPNTIKCEKKEKEGSKKNLNKRMKKHGLKKKAKRLKLNEVTVTE